MRWAAYLIGVIGWLNFAVWTTILGAAMIALWPFDRRRVGMARAMQACWGRGLFWTNPAWRLRRGERVHGEGPYVVVSNHQSVVDIPNLLSVIPPVRIVARDGIFRVPLMGPFLRLSRQVRAGEASRDGREALEAGVSVLVFAEGTRSADGSLGRFRNGAFHLAREAGVPVLPVVIDGSRRVVPRGGWLPAAWRPEVHVAALAPVDPAAFASTTALKKAVHARMAAALEAL